MTYDLSILIPARSEMFVSNTVEDILKNRRGKTEIIVGLDGEWAEPGIVDHPDVRVVYVSESRGQRGMTNMLARLSQAKYVAKCDAHCSFDEGFDVKLMDAMNDHDDWTVVPIMRNLHAFDWKCLECGKKTYQGPTPTTPHGITQCEDCGNKDVKQFKRKVIWYPKPSPQSRSYCFDSEPHFRYFGEFNKRPEGKGDITPTMSLQGSFFMLTREKYWELSICDEDFGSWGSQGIEVAVKTWLSGGEVMCVQTTWYAHLFRTQGGNFGFPYPISGKQVAHAKQLAKKNFFESRYGYQKYPLSWLVRKFWPVSGWTDNDLERLVASEASAWDTTPSTRGGQNVSSDTVGSFSLGIAPFEVSGGSDQSEMTRITATPILTDNVVKNRDISASTGGDGSHKPRIHIPVNLETNVAEGNLSIPISSSTPIPNPTMCNGMNSNVVEQSSDMLDGGGNSQHSGSVYQKGIIFYTDNQLPTKLAHRVQNQVKSIGLPIVSASLKPMDKMGINIHVKMERGYQAYFTQILVALEASTADIVFFCEHDVLYDKSHFDFTPPSKDKFYYNTNVWRVRADGRAVTWEANQVAELCCYRELALEWYQKKLKEVQSGNFNRSYEPGGRDTSQYEQWRSVVPNIDIRHGENLTKSKWSPEDFRDKSTCINWQETTIDKVPGWNNLHRLLQ